MDYRQWSAFFADRGNRSYAARLRAAASEYDLLASRVADDGRRRARALAVAGLLSAVLLGTATLAGCTIDVDLGPPIERVP